ncbi:hypothetical protein ED733_000231 [Metarhizium rileyi]|uniref:non-specific serine/threonine protein kinase n=1 Tax=Metarhizium rileyi (strain RCEF 4871) TaxID=1649241 RepID=A0A5C6FZD3_METRR|nr:hypothetical protein ED733_000231 [Metarhizium rileyi]
MAHFTQEERDYIDENPLGHSLSGVREALRDAERNTCREASQSDDNTIASERPRLFMEVIGKLFSILTASDVSLSLASRTGRDTLGSDLMRVRMRIQQGGFEYQNFQLLSQLVIKKVPDIDIWAAVVTFVRSISQSTPPPTLTPSFETPITHSSASQLEQTRQKMEPCVFEEICHCTYRAVTGFHEKYFKGQKWNGRANKIWQNVKTRYSDSDKRWTQLPDAASVDEVCSWLLNLQQELLPTERAAYFRSTRRDKVGAEAPRQLDLLVKMKRVAADAAHDWKNVLVVGELKQSNQKDKSLWLQVGSAVRNVFASQPTRFFVHAFTLTGTEIETWIFDRSGPYSGAIFDIHEKPEKFIRVLCAYLMMSDKELGLDTFTEAKSNKLFITIPVNTHGKKQRQLELDPNPIAYQRAIVCRGTSCFLAKATSAAEFDSVVKYSWTSSMRLPEADLLTKANERGVKGLAKTPYDNRILRVLAISPPGRPISQFESVAELLEGLRDALKVHQSLYMDGKILHRDISENNIIITDPKIADGFKGMLIDLDLAKEEGKGPSGARHRTGTMEFMAIEVLLGISHTYRHDIEAFFYVLIWLCAHRGWELAGMPKKKAPTNVLSHWYTGTYKDMARNKLGDMDEGKGKGLDLILDEFPLAFDCVKPLCRTIRRCLFPYRNGLFTGTPKDPAILYDPIIRAFDETIAGLGQETLEEKKASLESDRKSLALV